MPRLIALWYFDILISPDSKALYRRLIPKFYFQLQWAHVLSKDYLSNCALKVSRYDYVSSYQNPIVKLNLWLLGSTIISSPGIEIRVWTSASPRAINLRIASHVLRCTRWRLVQAKFEILNLSLWIVRYCLTPADSRWHGLHQDDVSLAYLKTVQCFPL